MEDIERSMKSDSGSMLSLWLCKLEQRRTMHGVAFLLLPAFSSNPSWVNNDKIFNNNLIVILSQCMNKSIITQFCIRWQIICIRCNGDHVPSYTEWTMTFVCSSLSSILGDKTTFDDIRIYLSLMLLFNQNKSGRGNNGYTKASIFL